MAEITQEELNERVEVLKRFRSLLEQQREKFKEYLTVLEKQQDSINTENTTALIAHTELEQQVVKNIANLQKVIVPMGKIYNAKAASSAEQASIENLQQELNELQSKVLVQNQKNRDLLRVHIENLKNQMDNFKNPYKNIRSVYAKNTNVGNMVEIHV